MEHPIEVNNSFKTPQGTVVFQGELSQEEADYVIQMGLNYLLQNGQLPYRVMQDQSDMANLPFTPMDEDEPN